MKPVDKFCLVVFVLGLWLFLSALPKAESGHMLGSCTLNAAEHESAEGYFNCTAGTSPVVSFSVRPKGIPADVLRGLVGKDVEIVIREREPRKLLEMAR